jgi:hypothetical protein
MEDKQHKSIRKNGFKTDMKIGIIGSGNIGATTERIFVNTGHQVVRPTASIYG